MRKTRISAVVTTLVLAGFGIGVVAKIVRQPLVTGKFLEPASPVTAEIGSFPCNSIVSLDGRYVIFTNAGFREQLSVVDTSTGKLVSRVEFNGGDRLAKEGLYYGLTWDGDTLLVSRGLQHIISRFSLSTDGRLTKVGDIRITGEKLRGALAGIAMRSGRLYAADNSFDPATKSGYVHVIDPSTGKIERSIAVGGYPLQVVAASSASIDPSNPDMIFAASERDDNVATIADRGVVKLIKVGSQPTAIWTGKIAAVPTLITTNSGSDTLSVVIGDQIRTVVLRPAALRGLPSCTPLDVTFDGQHTAFVALGDLNSIAVVDTNSWTLSGYIPAGWYPSSLKYVNGNLIVANAKGTQVRNPNGKPTGPKGEWGQYGPNIIEGNVMCIKVSDALKRLPELTKQSLAANRIGEPDDLKSFVKPRVEHVVYVIKENRTYDQVYGDIPTGNGDPSLCLFPREVTPNQHALAERFALLDNFYVCAEVSADGWNWSTAGTVNEYGARNFHNGYSGRRSGYDAEGQNQGLSVDLNGLRDVAAPAGGYLWDLCARSGKSYRNYGFFVGEVEALGTRPDSPLTRENVPNKRALQEHTDTYFRQYDLAYADSDIWSEYGVDLKSQMKSYGRYGSKSRVSEWKREFDGYVANRNLPAFSMLRLPRDHTMGTASGTFSSRAMVADNDYAIGQLVDSISHSPYWSSTVICVLEDDAQSGYDHVDCHRSGALVISPWVQKGIHYTKFGNTDSMLRTMEVLLGMPPMNGYDAVAPLLNVFDRRAHNTDVYAAIKPSREIATEINTRSAYRSADSSKLIARYQEDSMPDIELNDILWHSIKGTAGKPKRAAAVSERDND